MLNTNTSLLFTNINCDDEVKKFFEDVEIAIKQHKTQFSIVLEDFNAKQGAKSVGETTGHFVWDKKQKKAANLVMRRYFNKRPSRKWIQKRSSRDSE